MTRSKLIGARYFNQGYLAVAGSDAKSTPYLNSPRDADGHGTHTLSTAGGSAVAGANVFGFGNGTATGGSPGARVAAYKVCYDAGCFGADILAAFDAAIGDGVDVLSVSLGGTSSSYARDVVGIGSFHAAMSGILVVASAGNSGPTLFSVCNLAPWIFTVGASTMDRSFPRRAVLGNKKHYEGASVSPYRLKKDKFYPLIYGASAKLNNASADDAEHCFPGTLDPKKAKGTIVVCLRGTTARADKSNQARLAGAVGAIVANDKSTANELVADAHLIPATHVTYEAGLAILNYLNTTRNPVARISNGKTVLGVKPAPVMAAFSSAGPNPLTPQILKPDITAPGVNVLAAFTGAKGPADIEDDKRKVPFAIMSGTSMSCPEVAGVVGLLKTLHPNWSPAAIKSAIMTTAGVISNSKTPIISSTGSKATPFNYGAGHINPNAAADPGLVYDTKPADYGLFLCAMVEYNATLIKDVFNVKTTCSKGGLTLSNLNYPTITIPDLKRKATVTRRVTNVGGGPATYKASVAAPAGFSVTVKPDTLKFDKDGEEKTFKVTVQATGKTATRGYAFGQLTWSDQKHLVASQIVVKNKLGKKIH
ncbi:unnamed protein product [Cuscuta epithymum]|uniref:Subtilisin-like protease SBT5.3 n=2 Tax=Cuscuta epithymum TaxID=186058 RepID=A0AAV0CJW1_9ASTE|nr:unnamed protein product [Cuscuta epithymum]